MLRQFLGVLGVLKTLVPDRIVDVFEAIAVENPEENTIYYLRWTRVKLIYL